MVLTKALILKGVIGATSVVVPASLMIAYRKEISSYFNPSNLTKFDQGLINYLENEGDIQFKITKGSEGTTDLTVSDLTFSNNNPITISAKIKVTTDTSNNIGTLTESDSKEEGKKTTLQKLNGTGNGTAWTWICEIQLKREGDQGTEIKEDYKNLILKNTK